MTEAAAKISSLPLRAVVGRVVRHLGYLTENARARYVSARRVTAGPPT
jgi:hypothetical protein